MALGLALFDERLHAGAVEIAGEFAALTAALLGVTVLARAEAPDAIAPP